MFQPDSNLKILTPRRESQGIPCTVQPGFGPGDIVDQTGNVLIRKPATAGIENRKGVILQAHMDMVPQKTPDKDHNFLTDPIEAYVDGDRIRTNECSVFHNA
ncbi:MAG: hypothetical protein WBB55_13910 [Anaerolineales bacterium]